MIANSTIQLPALSLLVLSMAAVPSNSEGNELSIQAEVYNALYEAFVQCDDDLDQSRSEFITDEFERNSGNSVSMELLTKVLAYNVQVAKQSIRDMTQEREIYISQFLQAPKVSSEQSAEEAKASKERHERIRQIDNLLKRERRYVEVRECVLGALEKTH